jgi:4a-hydroxytetrahydrobiopterin dehydratase
VSLSLVREYNPTRIHVLTPEQIAQELSTLAGWEAKDDMISKTYLFPGFSDAVAFIVRISHPLEALDHHPEIRNVYGKVFVGFTTHDQGNKITGLDVKAARAVEAIAARLPQKAVVEKR